jgi:hypothetical protein
VTSDVVALEPVVSWPREMEVGRSYLVTVDIRSAADLESWPYDEEQFELNCVLDAAPYLDTRVVDDPLLVLHRFGGTYRPARFIVSARQIPPPDGATEIWLSYVNRWGVVLQTIPLPLAISSRHNVMAQPSDLLVSRDRGPVAEPAQPITHPITITIDSEHPGPIVPVDFAGLSFERGPLLPGGNAGIAGNLFNPGNSSLVTLFRNLGLGNLKIGGGTVEQLIPAGTGSDGYTGIDNLFAFAAAAGVKVIYTFRMMSAGKPPVGDLKAVHAQAAGHIWGNHRDHVASFAIGNEPDWHAYHTYPGHAMDPAIYEEVAATPGSAYPSYLTQWRSIADAVRATAPGAPFSGPDLGAYTTTTYTPSPSEGVSWTAQLARDEQDSGRLTEVTQHYYVGGSPGQTTGQQAISNMLSPEWVKDTAIGTQPATTTYTPYPWLYLNNLAPVVAAGLRFRLTESNDYLVGVAGASNAYAAALWALDHLHWWAAHGAAGVNFHNRQWLYTATIVPDPANPGAYTINPKGYGIKAFTLGSAGQVKPVQIQNPDDTNLTAYCIGGASEYYVTIINKTHGADAADAAVTIVPPGPGVQAAEVMTLAGGEPGDARGINATLGGATITGDAPWNGKWSTLPVDPLAGITLTVKATTATIVKIEGGRDMPPP